MKYRDHRGSLGDSMETLVEIDPTREALLAHLKTTWPFNNPRYPPLEGVTVERYHTGGDSRIGWSEVWIVFLPGFGVLGFTDGDLR